MKHAHRIGAVAFALWGILHVLGGAGMLYTLSSDGGAAALSMLADNVDAAGIPNPTSSVVEGLYAFHSWNLLWIGALVLVVAIRKNWHNDMQAYWLNIGIVAAADAGLVVTLIMPGYMSWTSGSPGIVLFLIALVFASIGYKAACDQVHGQAAA